LPVDRDSVPLMNTKLALSLWRASAAVAVLSFGPASAQAQAYPGKPIRMIVPFAAGAHTLLARRAMTDKPTRPGRQDAARRILAGQGPVDQGHRAEAPRWTRAHAGSTSCEPSSRRSTEKSS
jgi:hypothetical protein